MVEANSNLTSFALRFMWTLHLLDFILPMTCVIRTVYNCSTNGSQIHGSLASASGFPQRGWSSPNPGALSTPFPQSACFSRVLFPSLWPLSQSPSLHPISDFTLSLSCKDSAGLHSQPLIAHTLPCMQEALLWVLC